MPPKTVCGMKVRVAADGSFFLPRTTKEINEILAKKYIKLRNQNRWFPKQFEGLKLEDLGNFELAYIVGKGPSLDTLRNTHFTANGCVFAINEAIHRIEAIGLTQKIFCIQQDARLRDSCRPIKDTLLISREAKNWYSELENKFVYNPEEFGCTGHSPSVACAIGIAKKLGVKTCVMLAFDAFTDNDLNYAKSIGYQPKSPSKFLLQKSAIEKIAQDIKIVWIKKTELSSLSIQNLTSDDILQPLSHNLEEHHEHDPETLSKSNTTTPN